MIGRHVGLFGIIALLLVGTAEPSMAQDRRDHGRPGYDHPSSAPPAPRAERVRARRGYVWVQGNWDWRNGEWVWTAGHWERQQRGRRWKQGNWEQRDGHYVWTTGGWQQPSAHPDAPPPPPRSERQRQRRGFIWVEGNWDWRDGDWVWVAGHFERAQRGRRWNPGRWDRDGEHYRWQAGVWIGDDQGAPPTASPSNDGDWRRIKVRHRIERNWENRGWVNVGAVNVKGEKSRDSMSGHIGAQTWDALAINVRGGDLDLYDVILHLANGRAYSPDINHHFRDGERTIVIELPPRAEHIKSIDFRYGREKGEGGARIEVWGMTQPQR